MAETASRVYQVLLLTPDGDVMRTQQLVACSDNQALRLAKSMVDGHAVDVWDGLRFIEHFDPDRSTLVT